MVSKDFEIFLKLYSLGIRGKKADIPEDIDIEKIYSYAVDQNAMVMIYHAINKSFGDKYQSSDLCKNLRQNYMKTYVANCQRQEAALWVLEKLNAKGLKYKVIKGMFLSKLYDDPMTRSASDVDLYVSEEDILKTVGELKELGFSIKAEELGMDERHHISCFHPKARYFEVHHRFYDDCYDEIWFENKFREEEENIEFELGNVKMSTLGTTDGFIFNYLHMIKHFLLTGITIQQISDILLYAAEYKNSVDWDRVEALLSSLNYKKFFDGVMTIGTVYMDFGDEELPKFTTDKNAAERILNDLEKGGAYGNLQRRERDKFYHSYTKSKFEIENKEISYEKYILDRRHISLLTKIFSRKKILKSRYPFLNSKPWLLPVAWVMRWAYGVKIILNKKITFKEYIHTMPDKKNNVINERMETVKDLGML